MLNIRPKYLRVDLFSILRFYEMKFAFWMFDGLLYYESLFVREY